MANHKSAAKRARQSVKRNTVNSRTKSTVRSYEKKLRKAIESKDEKSAEGLLKTYTSRIDKAAKTGVYHYRTAARKISRLATAVKQIGQ